jgi:hypothetical protein
MALGRRKRVLLGVATFLLIAGFVAWRRFRISDLTNIGTGYTAQQTCACIFIGGRTLESCVTDLDPLARRLVSVRVGTDEVTASSIGVVTATARYQKGFGCSLQN